MSTNKNIVITNGQLLDPSQNRQALGELWISGEKIVPQDSFDRQAAEIIDASGKWVCPGLLDIHCHLREPGQTHKEDILSGSQAAVQGGFTDIFALANTSPPVDSVNVLKLIQAIAASKGKAEVHQYATLSLGMAGEELSPMRSLWDAGAVAFSDDGLPYRNMALLKRGLEYARSLGAVIVSHSEDLSLAEGGGMHPSKEAFFLGYGQTDPAAEVSVIAREIELARSVPGGRLHFAHISTARSVELIRRAKNDGISVTAETTPHHLILNYLAVCDHGAQARMNPPLRTDQDRAALIAGLVDGSIDALATDHAPHALAEKGLGFAKAPYGILGFETALPLYLEALYHSGLMKPLALISKLTSEAAKVMNYPIPSLKAGYKANVTVIDPDFAWLYASDQSASKSTNSPFFASPLRGRATESIVKGKRLWSVEEKK